MTELLEFVVAQFLSRLCVALTHIYSCSTKYDHQVFSFLTENETRRINKITSQPLSIKQTSTINVNWSPRNLMNSNFTMVMIFIVDYCCTGGNYGCSK